MCVLACLQPHLGHGCRRARKRQSCLCQQGSQTLAVQRSVHHSPCQSRLPALRVDDQTPASDRRSIPCQNQIRPILGIDGFEIFAKIHTLFGSQKGWNVAVENGQTGRKVGGCIGPADNSSYRKPYRDRCQFAKHQLGPEGRVNSAFRSTNVPTTDLRSKCIDRQGRRQFT